MQPVLICYYSVCAGLIVTLYAMLYAYLIFTLLSCTIIYFDVLIAVESCCYLILCEGQVHRLCPLTVIFIGPYNAFLKTIWVGLLTSLCAEGQHILLNLALRLENLCSFFQYVCGEGIIIKRE